MARKQTPTVDICLLLEGTYPYVSGGVSTWVHQIISAYPGWKFGIFYLGGQREPGAVHKYQAPSNVVVIEEQYLFDPTDYKPSAVHRSVPASWNGFYASFRKLFVRLPSGTGADLDAIVPLMEHVMQQGGMNFEDFYHSHKTWEVLRELYDRYAPDESFIHFFWNCRYIIEPLWKLARALPRVPKARVYHAACTGYAGFLGAVLSHETGVPLLLSEHGIYLKERIQDICRSPWIPEFPKLRPTLTDPPGSLRQLWMGFFDLLARLCYSQSTHLVSLFAKNAGVQQHFGAEAHKMSIVPNGIGSEACDALYSQRAQRRMDDSQSRVVGFLGRVVTIKDVKTLLRAARLVCDELPDAQFLIAGPTDEEPEYHRDCVELTQQLQIENNVQFLGLRRREDVLPLMDVMVLTSISEGLPFVVLEAMASGVPLVSTDVGACRELLEGRPGEVPPLGACGILTEIGNTDQIARSLVRILTDPELQQQMSEAGRMRASQHYHERNTLDDYRQIYEQLIA